MTDDLDWAEEVRREVESARRKQQQQPNVCAQCGGGENTDPSTDAPTIPFGGVLFHPQCLPFYNGSRK